jgi:hypothetical protein
MTEEGEFKKRFDIEGLVIMSDSPEEYDSSRQDGLRAYQGAIPKEFYTMKASRTQHVRIPNIRDRSNNNMVERLHGTIRQRNKVMRGLDEESTAQTMMDGMRIYYNFIRPHMALNGKTPAENAQITKAEDNKWQAIIKKSVSWSQLHSDI